MSSTYAGDPTNYPANITIPDDGDAADAASVNVAFEGLADRTAFLEARAADLSSFIFSSGSGSGDPADLEDFAYDSIGTTLTASATIEVDVTDCEVGDVLIAHLTAGYRLYGQDANTGGGVCHLRCTDGSGTVHMLGAKVTLQVDGGEVPVADDMFQSFHLQGHHVVDEAGTNTVGLAVRLNLVHAGSGFIVRDGVHLHVMRVRAA